MQISKDSSTSIQPTDHTERDPTSRVKLIHPLDEIMGNTNELTLRKPTIEKYVANFVSYSSY